ncbi:MAG: VOC family protein [Cellvibrionales bacterium]|nr:VOC family protein [Cellvibrionales bacterium]
MKNIKGINHVGIRVSSYEASKAFYGQLGFEEIAAPGESEPVAIVEHPSGININFIVNANTESQQNILMEGDVKYTGITHIAIEVDDLDQLLQDFEQLGVVLSGGPMRHPTGRACFVRDPDLNVLEFFQAD